METAPVNSAAPAPQAEPQTPVNTEVTASEAEARSLADTPNGGPVAGEPAAAQERDDQNLTGSMRPAPEPAVPHVPQPGEPGPHLADHTERGAGVTEIKAPAMTSQQADALAAPELGEVKPVLENMDRPRGRRMLPTDPPKYPKAPAPPAHSGVDGTVGSVRTAAPSPDAREPLAIVGLPRQSSQPVTVGRVLHFYRRRRDGGFDGPMCAHVARVFGPDCCNAKVLSDGTPRQLEDEVFTSLRVFDPFESAEERLAAIERCPGFWLEWMPYQKGQAARAERAEGNLRKAIRVLMLCLAAAVPNEQHVADAVETVQKLLDE